MDRDAVITPWIKSSYSNTGANCVELAITSSGEVAVRDSKDPDGGMLTFTVDEWHAFVAGVKGSRLRSAAPSLGPHQARQQWSRPQWNRRDLLGHAARAG